MKSGTTLVAVTLAAIVAWCFVIFALGCSKKDDDEDTPYVPMVTAEQLTALESMAAQVRLWAPRCGVAGIACGDDSDGDSMLWAGMLCASGEPAQCAAAKSSISEDGKVGRSPERVYTQTENSSSRDMFLGALLFILTSRDNVLAINVYGYLKTHGYKLCDDATDNRCDVSPAQHSAIWGTMAKVWLHIGLTPSTEMKVGDATDDTIIKLQSSFAPAGYTLHLSAVEIYLRQLMGVGNSKTKAAANTLRDRQPENPFFEYLARGKTERAAALTLKYCPKVKPETATQWWIQRDTAELPWLRSFGWDCLFLNNILH